MELEVGKAYKARNGAKVTVIKFDYEDKEGFPFEADLHECHWYKEDGSSCVISKYDLISEWVDAPKYNAGDIVTIEVTIDGDYLEQKLNSGENDIYLDKSNNWKIISHTPAPEPEFDWSTVKTGMAFENMHYKPIYYVGKNSDGILVFDFSKVKDRNMSSKYDTFGGISSHLNASLKRAPEHDIEVK